MLPCWQLRNQIKNQAQGIPALAPFKSKPPHTTLTPVEEEISR